MRINKILAAAAAVIISVSAVFAQDNNAGNSRADGQKKWQERIDSEKIAFLTKELDLSPQEAQAFWPVYNQAKNEKTVLFEAAIKAYKALDEGVKAGKTGKEMQALVENYCNAEKAVQEVDGKYVGSYMKVLPAEKVAKLLLGEEKFRRNQIHKLHNGNDNRRQPAQQRKPADKKPGEKRAADKKPAPEKGQ